MWVECLFPTGAAWQKGTLREQQPGASPRLARVCNPHALDLPTRLRSARCIVVFSHNAQDRRQEPAIRPVPRGAIEVHGIGPGRLMGTIVEVLSDEKGIIWPENIAPFKVHLLALGEDENVRKSADEIYSLLLDKNIEVLYDDRIGASAGEKFADADLLGMPLLPDYLEEALDRLGYSVEDAEDEAL